MRRRDFIVYESKSGVVGSFACGNHWRSARALRGFSAYWEHDGRRFGGRRCKYPKRDMALFSTRTQQSIGRAGEILGWILVLSLVLGPWIAWFIGEPYRHGIVREGELCGPGQRWTYAQPKYADSDLSCEPD